MSKEKRNRKIPKVHPSKLKNQIFGDASKMFEPPVAVNTNQPAASVAQQQQRPLLANPGMGTNSLIAARATDTNRTVALKRLQVYEISCI